ncbi:ParB/RepB/Spo0J family partition protein [bacterium]|nr:ParB/RepB/Spo0J family partition protein [bacterium]
MEVSSDPSNFNKKPGDKRALGRGLAALLGDSADEAEEAQQVDNAKDQVDKSGMLKISLKEISANSEQPRQVFNEAKLQELADSIKEQGLIQPILLRKMGEKSYQIIAGERRFRASKIAGLTEVPAIIREESHTKQSNDLASLIENIQREELSAIELARAYGKVLSDHSLTQEQLSQKLGISRVALANTLRLLKLPEDVKELISAGRLTEGHGRALLALENDEEISKFAQRILSENLSVRDVEARTRLENTQKTVSQSVSSPQNSDAKSYQKSAHLLAIEDELRQVFGTKVQIRGSERKGTIEIFYAGQDSFNRLVHDLRKTNS